MDTIQTNCNVTHGHNLKARTQTPGSVLPPTTKPGVVFSVQEWKPPLKVKQRRDQIYMEIQLQPGLAGMGPGASQRLLIRQT
jgi:hypothetical protein